MTRHHKYHEPVYWLVCPTCKGHFTLDDVPDHGFSAGEDGSKTRFCCPNCGVVVEAEEEK
jgi:transcription initiation factor IIE alpha subunit